MTARTEEVRRFHAMYVAVGRCAPGFTMGPSGARQRTPHVTQGRGIGVSSSVRAVMYREYTPVLSCER